jgi:hypothetical protein
MPTAERSGVAPKEGEDDRFAPIVGQADRPVSGARERELRCLTADRGLQTVAHAADGTDRARGFLSADSRSGGSRVGRITPPEDPTPGQHDAVPRAGSMIDFGAIPVYASRGDRRGGCVAK